MAVSTASSSRHGAKGSRTHSSKVSVRHQTKKSDQDAISKPKNPDKDELRRIRAAYFGIALAQKDKVIKPKTSTQTSITTRTRSASGFEQKRTSKHKSSSSRSSRSSKSQKSSTKNDNRAADYVYGPRPSANAAPNEQSPSDEREHLTSKTGLTERRRRPRLRSPPTDTLSAIAESEITPDDSISVVAERQLSKEHSRSGSSRPSSKRRSTTSSRLLPVQEDASETRSVTSSPKKSKRDSSLLSTLLRRNTTISVPQPPRLIECLTCGSDDVPHPYSAKLSCGHRMCHDCLKRVFEMSVKDPAHMPPRCCTNEHIPLKHVDALFDLKFKVLWNRKYQEYHTKNRIYCPDSRCGEWIKPRHIHTDGGRKYALCPRCRTKVCTLCNNKMHRSRECPKDPEIAKLVEQAKEKGWQRCFSCSSMVELKEGCNHMTCRCMAEFCMLCGAKWKTCDCAWFNYSNLPNPDALNDMRVPQPIQVIYRRVYNAGRPQQAPQADPAEENRNVPLRNPTYQDELDQRRRQERLDADLARRLQFASIMDPHDGQPVQRPARVETWGLGNAADHFMNDDFVQNAANVVMSAFGDTNLGRRGDRASGRRRRARQPEQDAGDAGLVPNFLGDQSVLGIGPATRPARAPI